MTFLSFNVNITISSPWVLWHTCIAHGNEYGKAAMSEVVIEELALMIHIGEDSFEVLVNRSTNSHELVAEVDLRPSTPFTVAELIADERLEGIVLH